MVISAFDLCLFYVSVHGLKRANCAKRFGVLALIFKRWGGLQFIKCFSYFFRPRSQIATMVCIKDRAGWLGLISVL